jgi:hypothetical protein
MKQDLRIYGKEYHLWREGDYLGTAVWVDDPNIGESFIKQDEDDVITVFIADEWEFKSE